MRTILPVPGDSRPVGATGACWDLEDFRRQRRQLFYPKADLPIPDSLLRAPASGDADQDECRSWVAAVCIDAFAEQPLWVRPLDEKGTFHRLYRVVLSSGRPVVIRVNALGERHRDYLLYLDPWVMTRLRAAGLPALQIHRVDLSRRLTPFDYEILEEARGVSLTTADSAEERIRPLLFELGRFAARLHAIRTAGFGFLDAGSLVHGEDGDPSGLFASWSAYVTCNLDAHVSTCLEIGAVNTKEARRIHDVFARAGPMLGAVEPALLHGDLGNPNVFVDGTTISAVIDWEDCLSGDPVFEIAFWATFHPDRRHPAFLEGYNAEGTLPADFPARFWLYYLRIALSKTVLRHRLGIRDRAGREPAARRIQKGLDKVEASAGRRESP